MSYTCTSVELILLISKTWLFFLPTTQLSGECGDRKVSISLCDDSNFKDASHDLKIEFGGVTLIDKNTVYTAYKRRTIRPLLSFLDLASRTYVHPLPLCYFFLALQCLER